MAAPCSSVQRASVGPQRGSYPGSVALAVAGVLFCRLNKFTLVYFSLLAKPWMVLLAYSSAYSASSSLFLVRFRELILCQSSAYLGSPYGALIGKRLVGNMTPESEVRFCRETKQKIVDSPNTPPAVGHIQQEFHWLELLLKN